jgi:5,5'-dehydrodivanillate O-demethylase oxygenase subunit
VTKTHVTGEAAERFTERQRERREQRATLTPAPEVAESILRGEARLWDFPGKAGVMDPRMFNIGDYVTQVGQGPHSVMNDSHLGRGDVEVAMLRRLYRRELRALAEGQPLTQWVIPDDLNVRVSED